MSVKGTRVTREAVARLAYELYLRRGRQHGNDIKDWLTAERMLKEKLNRRGNNARLRESVRRLDL
jgi:hypothetical protein